VRRQPSVILRSPRSHVMATLGVVQYSLAISAKTKLNAVADAAALQPYPRRLS